jgi:uncharacterized protein DUF695
VRSQLNARVVRRTPDPLRGVDISVDKPEEKGIIGQGSENGLPVIYKLVDELPSEDIRSSLPWLTVIAWRYDPEERNGMPPISVNDRMLVLEHSIDAIEAAALCRHAYSRTGNGLKELVYYITDRGQFMTAFNDAVRSHARYPIEIDFYEDREWVDFQKVLSLFEQAH